MTIAEKFNHNFKNGPFKLFDSNGNKIYHENSMGFWSKREYDSNGNKTHYEDSEEYWSKNEYDSNGNLIYFKDSTGFWSKSEFDSNGNEIYYENSNGMVEDNRSTPTCNGKIVEIDGKKYELKEV
jgi:uncharacterized membrane protein